MPDDIANLLRVGAIGHFTNKTIDAGVALALLPKKLKDFGAAVVESKRNFSELNFKMAATFTRLDAERLGRNVKLAAGTSGTTQDLAKAQSKFEEKLLPYATASINILNKILEAVLGTASNFPDFLKAGLSAAFPFLAGPIKDSIDGAKAAINGTTAAINSQKNNDDRATTDALRKMVMGLADKIGDRKRPPMKSAPPMAMPGAHRRSGGGFGA